MEQLRPFSANAVRCEVVIIEMFGGDNNLSHFVHEDLEEMAAGMRGNVVAIALVDFSDGPASVVEVSQETGIHTLEEWGEIDTGDPEVLARFVSRALVTYPTSTSKMIGFWDHGTGVFDETDASEVLLARQLASVGRSERSRSLPARRLFFPKAKLRSEPHTRAMLHDDTNGGVLTTLEAGKMLKAALGRANQSKVDVIFSDTCLNAMIEVLEELGPHSRCFIASSDLEPGDGWNYASWLASIEGRVPGDALEWGRCAVDAFYEEYRAKPSQHPCTLGAFSTGNGITDAFGKLVAAARSQGAAGFYALDRARSRTLNFANRDSYDLADFASLVMRATSDSGLRAAAGNLAAACEQACVSAKFLGSPEFVRKCHGLAFWFPSSRNALMRDVGTYERLTFAARTGWADYLKDCYQADLEPDIPLHSLPQDATHGEGEAPVGHHV